MNAEILVPRKELLKWNALLSINGDDGAVDALGYPEDSTLEVYSVEFEDGIIADIRICSGQSNFFCDLILFEPDGEGALTEVALLDCAETVDGIYEFAYNGKMYIVRVKCEK